MTHEELLKGYLWIYKEFYSFKNIFKRIPDHPKQKVNSIILNIQRGYEAAIDLAMHVVAEKKWGIPQTSRDAFDILQEKNILDRPFSRVHEIHGWISKHRGS